MLCKCYHCNSEGTIMRSDNPNKELYFALCTNENCGWSTIMFGYSSTKEKARLAWNQINEERIASHWWRRF